jgi:hypothetical protein
LRRATVRGTVPYESLMIIPYEGTVSRIISI